MQSMSLPGLATIALLWTVGVAILASRIGGTLGIIVAATFILPLVFSSIDAAWQAAVMTPSLHRSGKSPPVRRAKTPVEQAEAIPEGTSDEPAPPEPAVPEPLIPDPADPDPIDLGSPLPAPAFPVGETLQL